MAFEGFVERDFQSGIDATNWRRELGAGLRETLSATLGTKVDTYPFPHKPALYVREKWDERTYDSKLHVRTDEEGLRTGYYVERKLPRKATDDPNKRRGVDDDWPKFIRKLGGDGILRAILQDIAGEHELYLRIIVGESSQTTVPPVRLQDPATLDQIQGALKAILDGPWVDVYIDRFISKESACNQSAGITTSIVDTLVACWPLYQATLREDYVYRRE